jgi:hypothetical protein
MVAYREISKCLRISDKRIAIPRALLLAAKSKQFFEKLRRMRDLNEATVDPIHADYSFELDLNEFGKPMRVKVQAEAHEQEAVNSAYKRVLQSTSCGKCTPESLPTTARRDIWISHRCASGFTPLHPIIRTTLENLSYHPGIDKTGRKHNADFRHRPSGLFGQLPRRQEEGDVQKA